MGIDDHAQEDPRGELDLRFLKDIQAWCANGRNDRYTLFMVLMTPDGRMVTAFPGWAGKVEGDEAEELNKELYSWVDRVFEKRDSPV
ncbi:MAG TPA: hypothetical protein VIY48_11645 [Candidatus Paceibacterota bacterium]